MLMNYMKPGTKILGLSRLINSGRPGFSSSYRVVVTGSVMGIEFFDAAKREANAGMMKVGILPYLPGNIAELSLMLHHEVISGEFTGCIMSLYKKGAELVAAHVDTNPDTSQRLKYSSLKNSLAIRVVDDYDTTGKLQEGNSIILCIANKDKITRYVVGKGTHSSYKKVPVPGAPGQFQTGQFGETIYTVMRKLS